MLDDPIKTCPPYDESTHRAVLDVFDEGPDGAGGVQLVQRIEPLTEEEQWSRVRSKRDALLAESDRLSGTLWADRWAALTEEERSAWTTYRQALRDLPEAGAGPLAVVWPEQPGNTPTL